MIGDVLLVNAEVTAFLIKANLDKGRWAVSFPIGDCHGIFNAM
jgi:hypothetical protein